MLEEPLTGRIVLEGREEIQATLDLIRELAARTRVRPIPGAY